MSMLSKDEQLLLKIRKYLKLLGEIFQDVKDLDNIDESRDGLALSQCLINLHELACRIEDRDLSVRVVDLITNPVATMRHIAAHDYESLNWFKVKRSVKKLLSTYTNEFLDECQSLVSTETNDTKDYLDLFNRNKK